MNTLTRDGIIVTARRWIGTPYHHQASVCGIGADCLGLVRGVWRDLYGVDAEMSPVYSLTGLKRAVARRCSKQPSAILRASRLRMRAVVMSSSFGSARVASRSTPES
nr:hypothetical protein [Frankia sp. AgW1.1]